MVNLISALFTLVGSVLVYSFGAQQSAYQPLLLGLVAGFFIYIAASDIIPDIHKAEYKKLAGAQTTMFILGVALISYLVSL